MQTRGNCSLTYNHTRKRTWTRARLATLLYSPVADRSEQLYDVAVLRVASSKHMRDLRGALAMQGRGGLDSVIAAFARADGDGDVEEMIGASDDEVDDGSSGSYMSDDDGSREEEEGAEEELSPQGR